jgi:hypothetical protein
MAEMEVMGAWIGEAVAVPMLELCRHDLHEFQEFGFRGNAMTVHVKRFVLSVALTLVALIAVIPLGQADSSVSQAQAQANANAQVRGPDASTADALASLPGAAERAQLVSDAEALRPFLSVAKNGLITLRPGYQAPAGGLDFAAKIAEINSGIKDYETQRAQQARVALVPGRAIQADARWWCGYLPNWVLEAYAIEIIILGGVVAIVGGFIDLTIVGIPLGAVLNALGVAYGITGGLLLWYFDKYYPNGAWLCLHW